MENQIKRWLTVVTASAVLCGVWVMTVPVSAVPVDESVGRITEIQEQEKTQETIYFPDMGCNLGCYFENNGTVTINGFSPEIYGIELIIPRKLSHPSTGKEYTVSTIGAEAFKDASNLSTLVIPNTIKWIGDSAFLRCGDLTKVDMEDSTDTTVKELGTSIFAQCHQLTDVTLPNSVTKIPYGMFQDCWNLKRLTIRGNIESVGENAFCCSDTSKRNQQKYITFGDGVTKIGSNTFNKQDLRLVKAVIPSSVTSIASDAFLQGSDAPVIEGKSGTEAETYAKNNGNPFCELKKNKKTVRFGNENGYPVGDVTVNYQIDAEDYGEIQRELAEYISFSNGEFVIADVNGDGVVNVKDVTHLQRFLVNQHVTLG